MQLHRPGIAKALAQRVGEVAVVHQRAGLEHVPQAPEQLEARLLAAAGTGAGHPAAHVADLVALDARRAACQRREQQAAHGVALHRGIALQLDDFQRLQPRVQVVHSAAAVQALVAHGARVVGAVGGRAHQRHAAFLGQKALLRSRQRLAAVEDFFHPAPGPQALALRGEQRQQVRRHANQGIGLVLDDLLGDEFVVGQQRHGQLQHTQVLQDGPEADEAAVQVARSEKVHHPVGGGVKPGGHHAVGGGGHLGVVVGPAEAGIRHLAAGAATAHHQTSVRVARFERLKATFVQNRHARRGQHLRWLQRIELAEVLEHRRPIDRHAPRQLLQRVHAVVRRAQVAVHHLAGAGDAAHAR